MNILGNNNIPSSKKDDDMLTAVTEDVANYIKDNFLCKIPDTWDIECGLKKLRFEDIKENLILNGLSIEKANEYYGGPSSIETDAHIIYITINYGDYIRKYPIFMGEMKKQGTNDIRIAEGKKKQAIGNAAPDRVAKNFCIAADYCFTCDKTFFPYNVFLHGCDFDDNTITTTTKAKLQPFFGKLNNFNPYFDKELIIFNSNLKGGSCFFQKDEYTYNQLYEICKKCCEEGIRHYLNKNRKI